jgi:hypothetical protein
MNSKDLHTKLEQLRGELHEIDSLEEGKQQLLQKLISDIERLIETRESDPPPVTEPLGESLKEGIELFEASHPRATMLMGEVIEALAKMGI